MTEGLKSSVVNPVRFVSSFFGPLDPDPHLFYFTFMCILVVKMWLNW